MKMRRLNGKHLCICSKSFQNCGIFTHKISYIEIKVVSNQFGHEGVTYKHLPNCPGQVKVRFGHVFWRTTKIGCLNQEKQNLQSKLWTYDVSIRVDNTLHSFNSGKCF